MGQQGRTRRGRAFRRARALLFHIVLLSEASAVSSSTVARTSSICSPRSVCSASNVEVAPDGTQLAQPAPPTGPLTIPYGRGGPQSFMHTESQPSMPHG